MRPVIAASCSWPARHPAACFPAATGSPAQRRRCGARAAAGAGRAEHAGPAAARAGSLGRRTGCRSPAAQSRWVGSSPSLLLFGDPCTVLQAAAQARADRLRLCATNPAVVCALQVRAAQQMLRPMSARQSQTCCWLLPPTSQTACRQCSSCWPASSKRASSLPAQQSCQQVQGRRRRSSNNSSSSLC